MLKKGIDFLNDMRARLNFKEKSKPSTIIYFIVSLMSISSFGLFLKNMMLASYISIVNDMSLANLLHASYFYWIYSGVTALISVEFGIDFYRSVRKFNFFKDKKIESTLLTLPTFIVKDIHSTELTKVNLSSDTQYADLKHLLFTSNQEWVTLDESILPLMTHVKENIAFFEQNQTGYHSYLKNRYNAYKYDKSRYESLVDKNFNIILHESSDHSKYNMLLSKIDDKFVIRVSKEFFDSKLSTSHDKAKIFYACKEILRELSKKFENETDFSKEYLKLVKVVNEYSVNIKNRCIHECIDLHINAKLNQLDDTQLSEQDILAINAVTNNVNSSTISTESLISFDKVLDTLLSNQKNKQISSKCLDESYLSEKFLKS